MNRVTGVLLGVLATFALSTAEQIYAVELTVSTGTMDLPNSDYHLLTFDTQLAFRLSHDAAIMVQAGTIPPFKAHGFTQIVPYFSINGEWVSAPSGARVVLGTGLGSFADVINGQFNPFVALVFHGGVRVGGERLGLQLMMSSYIGIQSISAMFNRSSLAWPMYNFLGGLYVAL